MKKEDKANLAGKASELHPGREVVDKFVFRTLLNNTRMMAEADKHGLYSISVTEHALQDEICDTLSFYNSMMVRNLGFRVNDNQQTWN